MESVARAVGAKTPPPLNRSRLRFLYYNQRYSIEKARRELGYEPQVSYREGLPPALDWIAAEEDSAREAAEGSGSCEGRSAERSRLVGRRCPCVEEQAESEATLQESAPLP